MLNNLYKLYLRNTTKTPLEDFTTEALGGILKFDANLIEKFAFEFLEIPNFSYEVKTQVKYDLIDDPNCIIDMVLESDNVICFIENKVNSSEGHRQLDRYCKVLDEYAKNGYQTYLYYCTKYHDPKTIKTHNFKQIRWFQIAKFLKPFCENSLIQDYLNFLKLKDMSQDLTINTKDLLTIENLFDTMSILKGYMERAKPVFTETFKSDLKVSDGFNATQIIKHKRMIYYYKDIIATGGWSELKYGFQTSSSNIYVGIWIDKTNSQYKLFKEHFANSDFNFELKDYPNGFAVELKSSLNKYLNDENADSEISIWFNNAFANFAYLIKQMSNINWKINVA